MPAPAVDSILDTLRQLQLVTPARSDELAREAARYPEPRALAKVFVQRGWLTPYQVNLLLQDRSAELVLGAYQLLERLGEGTRGQVFKARHQKMSRTVALKIIRKDLLADSDAVQRFYHEVELASQLAHANIVHAYDAGPMGANHFLAMEYVEGVELAKLVADEGPLPWRQACAYVIQAALGLHHAFERGLLHREISPANLFVTGRQAGPATKKKRKAKKAARPDEWGIVKIMDFGQGRLRLGADSDHARTPEGLRRSLLDYAAPELVLCMGPDVRADIYALGCTFAFLLTGRPPYPGGSRLAQADAAHWQDLEPRQDLPAEVPAEVAAVLRRMIAPTPEERPATPAEAAEDLIRAAGGDRSLCGPARLAATTFSAGPANGPAAMPLAASPRRSVRDVEDRRLRYVVWGGGLILVAGLALLLAQLFFASTKPKEEIDTAPDSVTNPELRKLIHLAKTRPETPDLWASFADFRLRNLDTSEGRMAGDYLRRVPSPLDRLSEKRIPKEEQYDWQPKELVGVLGTQRWRVWATVPRLLAYSPAAQLLAGCGDGDVVIVWEVASGRVVHLLRTEHGNVRGLAFALDGKTLATGGDDKNVRLINLGTAEIAILRGHGGGVTCVAFSPDGRTLASGGSDKLIKLWDVATKKLAHTLPAEHKDAVQAVAFAVDGKTLASGSKDGGIRLWDLHAKKARAHMPGHPGGVQALAFDPRKPDRLASGGADKLVRLWDAAAGHETMHLKPFNAGVNALAFTPDGRRLAAGSASDTALRLWDLDGDKERPPVELRQDAGVQALAFLAEGRSLAVGLSSEFTAVRFWDLSPPKPALVPLPPGHRRHLRQLAFTPDGRTLVSLSSDNDPRFWDLATLLDRTSATGPMFTNAAMALAPDGQTVAACGRDGKSVQLWDVATAQSKGTFTKGHGDRLEVLDFAPDGKTLASGGRDKTVRLWGASGALEKKVIDCANVPSVVAFTPDGQTLVIGGRDLTTLTLWDVPGGKERQVIKGIAQGMTLGALTPDGKTLAFVSKDNQVHLWDLTTGKEKLPRIARCASTLRGLVFSLDGKILIASAWDGQILFWKVGDRALPRAIPLPGPVTSLALALDNRHLAAGTGAGVVYLLRLGPVPPPGE